MNRNQELVISPKGLKGKCIGYKGFQEQMELLKKAKVLEE